MVRNLGFSFGRTPEGRDRELAELEQRLAEQSSILQTPETQTKKYQRKITSTEDYWIIPNVTYKGKIYMVQLSKKLLCDGAEIPQDGWARHREIVMPKGEFYTANLPLHHGIFSVLYEQRNNPEAIEAKQFIKEKMQINPYPITLTRIAYQPKGIKDKIIHNWGVNKTYYLEEEVTGPDGPAQKSDASLLAALLGSEDINKINEIYEWLNDSPIGFFRRESKPSENSEYPLRLCGTPGQFLHCCRNPNFAEPSFGIRIVEKLEFPIR